MSRSDPTVEQVLVALRRIVRAIDVHSHQLVKACGLTSPQLVLMQEVGRGGTPSPSELAKSLNLSNATVTGILDRLERRELVARRRSETDKRRIRVSLTRSGIDALGSAPSMLQDSLAKALAELDDWERSLLLASLQRLAGIMHAEGLDAAPILSSGPLNLTEDEILEVLPDDPPGVPGAPQREPQPEQ